MSKKFTKMYFIMRFFGFTVNVILLELATSTTGQTSIHDHNCQLDTPTVGKLGSSLLALRYHTAMSVISCVYIPICVCMCKLPARYSSIAF